MALKVTAAAIVSEYTEATQLCSCEVGDESGSRGSVCSTGSADHGENTRARATARRARSYSEEPGNPFWHSRRLVRRALLPVRILRGLAESRIAPVLLRNNGAKEPLPGNAL